jgi:hypothetical protein
MGNYAVVDGGSFGFRLQVFHIGKAREIDRSDGNYNLIPNVVHKYNLEGCSIIDLDLGRFEADNADIRRPTASIKVTKVSIEMSMDEDQIPLPLGA